MDLRFGRRLVSAVDPVGLVPYGRLRGHGTASKNETYKIQNA